MIPILFEHNTTDFATHGIGDLIDCLECVSELNDEGAYELSFLYPMDGELFSELSINRLIYVKANPWQGNQIFRIYGFEKPMDGKVRVNCQHISYDLANIPVKSFKTAANANCSTALNSMISNAVAINGLNISRFTFSSDITDAPQTEDKKFKLDDPVSARAVLLDGDSSIKGCYGGDLIFDNYSVTLKKIAGEDRGVTIEYGVDLMDLNQEENISEMVTGVLPYYRYSEEVNGEYEDRYVYGDIQYASGSFVSHRVVPVDLTSYFPNQEEGTHPTVAQLNSKAQEWMAAEDGFGEPEVNLTLSYASLGQDVRLYDAVKVRFVKLGLDQATTSKVTSYKYDVLNEIPLEIQVGKTKESVLFSLEDASRLRKGLLPPERIKNKSLTSDKYATGSVRGGGGGGGGALAKDGVKEENLEDEAVTTPKIHQYAVTAETLADLSVPSRSIQNGAVIEMKIGDLQVANIKLYQGARDAIAKVWEIDQLIAGRIVANGSVNCTYLNVNGTNYSAYGLSYTHSSGASAYVTVLAATGGG